MSGGGVSRGRTLVLGLGNPILTDDAVGLLVARAVRRACGARPDLEIGEAAIAGFDLLDRLAGFRRVILIDAARLGGRPGEIRRLGPEDLVLSERLAAMHEINLRTVLALGRTMGLAMPEEVVIFGIEVEDDRTFGERCTPSVAAAVPHAVDRVLDELSRDPRGVPPVARAPCDDGACG